jgi:membrane protease YdiL (CAAX protease family)
VLQIAAFAVASNIAAHAVWVFEKAWHGAVYAAPTGPAGTSPAFLLTYWVAISIALSTSSEMCFRGIMQSQLSRYMGLWSAIGIVVIANTFSHPWESLWPRFFGVVAILFAWSWLRHISGSLKACILTHIAAVMGGDIIFWLTGPVDFGQMSQTALVINAAVCALTIGIAVYLSRLITRGAGSISRKK